MQTRALRTLVRVSQVRSFALAAEQMNMTLSAVSMQIKSLEQELGAVLFDRGFRPPRLTPQGRVAVERAEAVLSAEAALMAVSAPVDCLAGRFHIGFVGSASVRLLPDFLKAAAGDAPEARFTIETAVTEVLEERLRQGRLDAAVLTAPAVPDPALDYRPIAEETLVFALPAAAAERSPAGLFDALPFLQFKPETGIGRLIARHVAGMLGRAPERVIELDGMEAIVECVKAGTGFTLLPRPDIERYADARLSFTGEGAAGLTRRLALATLKESVANRSAAALGGCLA